MHREIRRLRFHIFLTHEVVVVRFDYGIHTGPVNDPWHRTIRWHQWLLV